LRLFLRPLQRHARTALRQQDVLGALHERIALNDKLVVLVGSAGAFEQNRAVLHAELA
jgi:hypothetical protein